MNKLSKDTDNNYDIKELLDKNCLDYAKYVIKSRAIISAIDGLKPIHRRIVWAFNEGGLNYNNPRKKSANACGSVMAYSPHGDASIYDACVRLANDSVLVNIIDGKGSFSSITARDVQAGASRYTEMRLSKIATELLDGVGKEGVKMRNNFDDTRQEPDVLCPTFPMALCNPNIGIGVGISSSICSFNLREVIENTKRYIDNNELELYYPDFPTYGEIVRNDNELKKIYDTGIGKIVVRGKYHFDNNSIIFTEIPYSSTRESIIEKIIDMVKKGAIKDIIDVNDFTGAEGLNITIELKKNCNKELVLQRLFKSTPLETTFSCNFMVLNGNNIPVVLGYRNIINEWLIARRNCVKKSLEYDLNKYRKEFVLLKGLESIVSNLDEVIMVIRNSKSDLETIQKLIETFNINETQANYIADIKLRNLNKEFINKKLQRLDEVTRTGKQLSDTISNPKKIDDIIKLQLTRVGDEYSIDRKTSIIEIGEEAKSVPKEVFIDDFNCYVTITKEGYIKKHLRPSDTHKTKDGDEVLSQTQTTNKADVLILTDKANCYTLKAHTLETIQPSSLGQYIYSLIPIDKDEEIIYTVVTTDYSGFMLFAFEDGKVAKVPLTQYKSSRIKLQNAYSTNTPLINLMVLLEDTKMFCRSSIDKVLIFDTIRISPKSSRTTIGVSVMKSKNNSIVTKLDVLTGIDENTIDYYSTKTLNSVGTFIRKEDRDLF